MKLRYSLLLVAFGLLPWATGCPKPANQTAETHEDEEHAGEEEHGHTHEGDDELFWQRADLEHEGYTVSLGHHSVDVYTGHAVEPAVAVTKDGQPVADAKVFVTLLDEAGKEVITAEQATIYEPPTDKEPAHYAQAKVQIPKDAKNVTLRYRVELPGAAELTEDVLVETKTH